MPNSEMNPENQMKPSIQHRFGRMPLEIPNALSFFRLSCGRWRSQRSQHHLLHRRAEAGASFIVVEELARGDQRLTEIANSNHEDPNRIIGGCWVRWSGSMACA